MMQSPATAAAIPTLTATVSAPLTPKRAPPTRTQSFPSDPLVDTLAPPITTRSETFVGVVRSSGRFTHASTPIMPADGTSPETVRYASPACVAHSWQAPPARPPAATHESVAPFVALAVAQADSREKVSWIALGPVSGSPDEEEVEDADEVVPEDEPPEDDADEPDVPDEDPVGASATPEVVLLPVAAPGPSSTLKPSTPLIALHAATTEAATA